MAATPNPNPESLQGPQETSNGTREWGWGVEEDSVCHLPSIPLAEMQSPVTQECRFTIRCSAEGLCSWQTLITPEDKTRWELLASASMQEKWRYIAPSVCVGGGADTTKWHCMLCLEDSVLTPDLALGSVAWGLTPTCPFRQASCSMDPCRLRLVTTSCVCKCTQICTCMCKPEHNFGCPSWPTPSTSF